MSKVRVPQRDVKVRTAKMHEQLSTETDIVIASVEASIHALNILTAEPIKLHQLLGGV